MAADGCPKGGAPGRFKGGATPLGMRRGPIGPPWRGRSEYDSAPDSHERTRGERQGARVQQPQLGLW